MSELAFAPLARFADVVMGQSPGADLCNTEERGLPFLQGCAEFGPRHPHSEVYCSPPLRVAKTGSVLISVRAPVGTMNYADQDYCIGRGLGAFKAKSGVSNTVFLKHAVGLNAAYLHRRSHPVITIGALGEGVFSDDELLFVDGRDAARLVDFQLKAGDVVFSRVADVGRSVVVRVEQAGWIMSSNLMRIAVDESRARPDLVQMALASDSRIKAQIRARVNSGGRDVANSDVLNQLRFVWPDIEEQDRIIARANIANSRITSEQLKRSNLLAQKQGLMHDLLTGKVPVTVEEPEVVDG